MAHRILVLSTVHPLGHARHTMKVARGLAEEGFDVEVWGRGEAPEGLPNNLTVRSLPIRNKVERFIDLPRALTRALFGGHDLVLVVPPENVPVGVVARLLGKNVLWDVEEDSSAAIENSDWIPQDIRKPTAYVYRIFERLAASLFSGISLAEDSYASRFTNAARVEVIHNYPPKPPAGAPDPSRGKIAEKRWKQPGPRLLYVGAVTEHRGLLETVRIVELLEDDLPDICLDVIGAIPREDYHSRLMAARSKLKKPERITFHGHVPFDNLGGHFERAQIGLLPLWPQPNHLISLQTKLYEYALAGLPTVVGDVSLWRTLIDASKSGEAAEPRNPSDWAEAIHRLWKWGPQRLAAAGRRAHDLVVKNNWFWEPERARLATLCKEIIEGGL